mmetsp:Transcript_12478/g.12544  ORF Transcript_12478/g.12544 Transcript_12478/m.12544 type:complete len:84 (+) Transcript_12478:322-573(+)
MIHIIIAAVIPNIAVDAPTARSSGATKQLKITPPIPDPTYTIAVLHHPTVGSNLNPSITCMNKLKIIWATFACKSIGVTNLHI